MIDDVVKFRILQKRAVIVLEVDHETAFRFIERKRNRGFPFDVVNDQMVVLFFKITHIIDDQLVRFSVDDHDRSQRGIILLTAVINEIYRVPGFGNSFRAVREEFLPLVS